MSTSFYERALNALLEAGHTIKQADTMAEDADFAQVYFFRLLPLKKPVPALEFAGMIRSQSLGVMADGLATAVEKTGLIFVRHH